jgi:hypothetical protein
LGQANEEVQVSAISFIQGGDKIDEKPSLEKIKQKLAELSSVKNISFLLGAGASADAIPSMVAMHTEITQEVADAEDEEISPECRIERFRREAPANYRTIPQQQM